MTFYEFFQKCERGLSWLGEVEPQEALRVCLLKQPGGGEELNTYCVLCVARLCGTWEPWRLEGREVMEVTQTRKSRPFLRSPLPGRSSGWIRSTDHFAPHLVCLRGVVPTPHAFQLASVFTLSSNAAILNWPRCFFLSASVGVRRGKSAWTG